MDCVAKGSPVGSLGASGVFHSESRMSCLQDRQRPKSALPVDCVAKKSKVVVQSFENSIYEALKVQRTVSPSQDRLLKLSF